MGRKMGVILDEEWSEDVLTGLGDPHVQWWPHSALLACSLETQQSAMIYIVMGVGLFFLRANPSSSGKEHCSRVVKGETQG